MTDNALLDNKDLPRFGDISPDQVVPAIRSLVERNMQAVNELVGNDGQRSWANFVEPLEELEDDLARTWSPVSHLNGVMNNEAIRTAYNEALALLSEYGTWMSQHKGLFEAYQAIQETREFDNFNQARRTAIEQALRDFRLAGVALSDERRARYGQLKKRLSELTTLFAENVLDATNNWSKLISDPKQLAGLPETALAGAAQAASAAGEVGYLITLEFPSFYPVLTYADDRALRREVYTANCTRASDQGPSAGQWDNSPVMEEILQLRSELATLLGFADYSELSLAKKMAEQPDGVLAFLQQLAERSRGQALEEFRELAAFASTQGLEGELEAWDVAYYSEKLRQAKYDISQEAVRPYLPVNRALEGLFQVAQRLFNVQFLEVENFDTYHPDVRLFEITREGAAVARFYLDLFARKDKRGGAWMDDCRVRRRRGDGLQLPAAYLVCNFTPAVGQKPALLTHQELTTLFHEFGHGLHHMLTEQTVASVSGINGVAWDAVELPSQFLENWCWEREALAFVSGHCESGESLPEELLNKLLAARNFQSGMQMVRQLEFALFDFRLHRQYSGGGCTEIQDLLNEVRAAVAVVPAPEFNRFQHGFSHIFAGGYAAGYYSYKWAEVLSADAYARFEEEGIFNADAGESFRREILARGGSAEPMTLFKAFRGREPSIDPLLRHSGINR